MDPMGILSERLNWLRSEMGPLFGPLFPDVAEGRVSAPALNLWEDEGRFYAEAELPGFSIEDLELSVVGNVLTIKGARGGQDPKEGVWLRRERFAGPFSRTIEFSSPIDPDKVEASLKNGVLLVTLPKAETARPRKIEIKAGRK